MGKCPICGYDDDICGCVPVSEEEVVNETSK